MAQNKAKGKPKKDRPDKKMFCVSEVTEKQLKELTAQYGINRSQVVRDAVSLYFKWMIERQYPDGLDSRKVQEFLKENGMIEKA